MKSKNSFFIYKITSSKTDKIYIGFTSSPVVRWRTHLSASRNGKDTQLYRSMRYHGEDTFEMTILYESCDEHHTLTIMEPLYVAIYNSFYNGLNSNFGGSNVNTSALRESNSKRMKRKNPMKALRTNKGSFKKGHTYVMSKSHKQKISNSRKGDKNPMYGNSNASSHLNKNKETCVVCGKTTNIGNIKRWHNDKCRFLIK